MKNYFKNLFNAICTILTKELGGESQTTRMYREWREAVQRHSTLTRTLDNERWNEKYQNMIRHQKE